MSGNVSPREMGPLWARLGESQARLGRSGQEWGGLNAGLRLYEEQPLGEVLFAKGNTRCALRVFKYGN